MTGRAPTTYALVGDPVSRSVSPAMQRAAIAAAGLDADYVAVRVGRGGLAAVFPALLERFAGLNVTTPLKREALDLVDELRPDALAAGSVNTVISVPRRGVGIGDSTDGAGFIAALRREEPDRIGTAVVLGTGGAARAVSAALAAEGTRVTVSGRNGAAGRRLVSDLAGVTFVGIDRVADAVGPAELVVNATPVGGPGMTRSDPLPQGVALRAGTIAFDLVYRPRRTTFLRRAARAGCRSVEGVEMLIEQGARSFELWTELDAPLEAMRAAAYRALDAEVLPAPAASSGRA